MARACSGSTSSPADTTASRPGPASPSRAETATSRGTRARSSAGTRAGSGFALAGDYLNSPTASGSSSTYSNTQVFLQGSYVPAGKVGVQYQLAPVGAGPATVRRQRSGPQRHDRAGLRREANRCPAPTVLARDRRGAGAPDRSPLRHDGLGWSGHRAAGEPDRRGPGLSGADLRRRRVGVSPDPVDRTRRARHASGGIRCPQFTASAEAVHQRHYGGRNSDFVSLSAGLQPIRGVALTGSARLGNDGRRAGDHGRHGAGDLATTRRPSGSRGRGSAFGSALSRTAAFSPFGYAEFPRISSIAPVPETEWVTAAARHRAAPLVHAGGMVQRSAGCARPTGIPPTHSLAAATIRSKFLRQFPSGIFDLKLRLSVEIVGHRSDRPGDATAPRSGSGAPPSTAACSRSSSRASRSTGTGGISTPRS